MKTQFLRKDPDNTRLLLVFSGWSTAPAFYSSLVRDGWDLLVVYDYADLTLDTSFLDEYYTVYLLAWSLGVYCAERTLPAERITAAFAVNGTPMPVDPRYGIPPAIFQGTAAALDRRNLMKFRRRMMPDAETFANYFPDDSCDDIPALKKGLEEIAANEATNETAAGRRTARLPWTRAYASDADRIFPPANLLAYWKEEPEVELVRVSGAHWIPLGDILAAAIPDTGKVSRRFSKAASSYDTHAIAQHAVAVRLALMLKSALDVTRQTPDCRILEIGCGTGLFTREYARFLRPSEACFVDITDCGPFGIAGKETYVKGDAEKWIEDFRGSLDCILSASAIQWFADLPRFIDNCRRALAPGGIFAVSTFLPGNMGELDTLRPSPLIYPRLETLRDCMERNFSDIRIETEDIIVEFKSVREMLMHLKHTGVGGSAPSSGRSLKDMAELHTLTYRPVWLIGRKK